jgi:ATP-dependent Clp protease ATP-binding subunit ClpA
MIGKKTEAVLNRAIRRAAESAHEYFTLEHVLASLLDEVTVIEAIRAAGGDPSELKKQVDRYLDTEMPKIEKRLPSEGNESPMATIAVQRLVQRALFQVQSAGKDEILPVDLLVALFQARDSHAAALVEAQGVERLAVIGFLSHGLVSETAEGAEAAPESPDSQDGAEAGETPSTSQDPLSLYCVNLNERAQAGKIDPLVGRQPELQRMLQTLCRRRKNNPLLVGEAGVGKTALAEGLAVRLVAGEVPELLAGSEIHSLDLGALLAGTKFRGDFEARLRKVISALQGLHARGKKPVLFIDEIHTIIGAGSVSGGSLDAANLLKPLLSSGEIRCIGSTTYQEYRTLFEKDAALNRRFQKIDVPEPSQEEAVAILRGLQPRFEEHHRVRYTPEAIRAMVELSARHLSDRFLPDKAIDLLDEVGARARLAGGPETLDVDAVEAVVAQIARIPERNVSSSQRDRLRNLERDLRLAIFGQDAAIDAVTQAIRLARSGLRSGDRPVGSFLFCGPTGVGKTELSRQLALSLGIPLLRFDMSEYGEKHTVSRLIGAPPGYVGFEQAGLLTDGVLKNPHSVVLLDEIEKAHPDIWNILLQVMDHGTLTDNNGRRADFRNVVLLMTSNVGSREIERRPLGMGDAKAGAGNPARAVEQAFSPEFRNRLDAIVFFNPLDPLTIGQVVGKHLVELESQLLARQVEIEVGADVREWLAEKGYDRALGARPMARLIQDRLKKPLASELLFGKLEKGGKVRVSMNAERSEPVFEFGKARSGKPPKQERASTSTEAD